MVPIETLDCVLRACYCFSRGWVGLVPVRELNQRLIPVDTLLRLRLVVLGCL